MYSSKEYSLAKQNIRINKVKILLLDSNFSEIGELTGDTIEFPSFNINADSDIRRTCNVSLHIADSSFDITPNGKIWLDKYIKIFIGQKDIVTNEYFYTNMGVYIIDNPQKVYSPTENKLTIQGIDLMGKLTGLRNGNLEGVQYVIPQDAIVKKVIESMLEIAGIKEYEVADCLDDNGNEVNVPNEIKINVGGTIYNVLTALRDIMPNYQMYFDVNGVFHYNKIPSGENEEIMVNDDIWDVNLIDYKKNTNFDDVKNSIEVVGKTHEVQHYFDSVTVEGNSYVVKLAKEDSFIPMVGNKIALNIKQRILYDNIYIKILQEVEPPHEEVEPPEESESSQENEQPTPETPTPEPEPTYEEKYRFNIKDEYNETPYLNREDNYYVFKLSGEASNEWTLIDSTNILPENNPLLNTGEEKVYNAYIENNCFIVRDKDIDITGIYLGNFTIKFKTPLSGCELIPLPMFELDNREIPLDQIFEETKPNPLYFTKSYINGVTQLENNTVYTIKFSYNYGNVYAKYLGGSTPYAKVQDRKVNSPLSTYNIGEIKKVFSGGEYDNISSDVLAEQRANWELYNYCRLNDSVSITCVPIYWLDVNWLISITLPSKNGEETTDTYMIKSISISGGDGGTQSINLIKYYPYNPKDNQIKYSFVIHTMENDPFKRVEYLDDAIGKKPCYMDFDKGEFNYGDWEDAFFMPRPCMLRTNGVVDYYLNPNDYTQKIDGTPSDVNNPEYDGNAMMEWGSKGKKIYIYMTKEYEETPDQRDFNLRVTISNYKIGEHYSDSPSFHDIYGNEINHFYTSIYNGTVCGNTFKSISGQNIVMGQDLDIRKLKQNGEEYELETLADRTLINMLLVLIGKSTDTQYVFGYGRNSGENITGTLDKKGLFYGYSTGTDSVKVFGMENYWGGGLRSVVGSLDTKDYVYIEDSQGQQFPRGRGYFSIGVYEPTEDEKYTYYYDIDNSNSRGYTIDVSKYGRKESNLSDLQRNSTTSVIRALLTHIDNDFMDIGTTDTAGYSYHNYFSDTYDFSLAERRNNVGVLNMGGYNVGSAYNQNGAFYMKYTDYFQSSSAISYRPLLNAVPKYNITYSVLGITTVVKVQQGDDCLHPSVDVPTVPDFTFIGWSLTVQGEVLTQYVATEDVTLYAVYKANAKPARELVELSGRWLNSGFNVTEETVTIDNTDGYRYLTVACGGDGVYWMMHPVTAGWGHLYLGFKTAEGLEYKVHIQDRHYTAPSDNDEFDATNWFAPDKIFTIDITGMNSIQELRIWTEDSGNTKQTLRLDTVILNDGI